MAAPVKVRGRFYVQKDADGWTLVDDKTASCVSFETRREAEANATFARAYVRKWGEINLQSFPSTLADPFDPAGMHEDLVGCYGECRCAEFCLVAHPERAEVDTTAGVC